jgi:hypothetical protein
VATLLSLPLVLPALFLSKPLTPLSLLALARSLLSLVLLLTSCKRGFASTVLGAFKCIQALE